MKRLFSIAILTAAAVSLLAQTQSGQKTLAATLNVVLSLLWVPALGARGSAWAVLVCEMQLLGVGIFYICRHIGNPFRPRRWTAILTLNAGLAVVLAIVVPPLGLAPLPVALALYAVGLQCLGLMPARVQGTVRTG